MPNETPTAVLVCSECGRHSEGRVHGWWALLGRDIDGDHDDTFIFCPECARAELSEEA